MTIYLEWEEERHIVVEQYAVPVHLGGGVHDVWETRTVTRTVCYSQDDTPEMRARAEAYLPEFTEDHPGARIVIKNEEVQ